MRSHDIETDRILRAFIPSRFELITLPIGSLFTLGILQAPVLFQTANNFSNAQLSDYLHTKVQAGLSSLDRVIGTTVPLMIFWALVGVVVYILLFLIIGAYNAYRNDTPIERGMIVPKNYNHGKILRSSISHICIRILAMAMLIFWLYLLFTQALTYSSDLFLRDGSSFSLGTIGRSLLAVLILSAWLFVISLLSRCVVLRDRVFD